MYRMQKVVKKRRTIRKRRPQKLYRSIEKCYYLLVRLRNNLLHSSDLQSSKMSKKTITYVMAKTTNDDYQIIDSSEVYEYSRQWNDNPSMWPSEATWETDSGEKKIEIIYVGSMFLN